ncbi:MAG: DUF1844 domain-containing protein [Candidatus Zixiibacteriota bacterium]
MTDEVDVHFLQLLLSLQMGAMHYLGKTASPVDGKVERNLELAQHSIQLLEMLHKKTINNLTDEERKILDTILYDLRLNYIDEAAKGPTPDTGPKLSSSNADTISKEPS